jgi:hypothetical protein
MQVHIINSGLGTDDGFKDLVVHSLKLDHNDQPYAIVEHPFRTFDSCRAEFDGVEWVVDFD